MTFMKKLLYQIIPLLVITAVLIPFACSKKITGRTDDLPALQPDKTDIDAGSWKPILLTSANEFSVSAPVATTTPEYIAQINEIKSWQASLTDDEKNNVKYWSAGAVLRWN